MNKDDLLALPDWVLTILYVDWSKSTDATGWLHGGEDGFVKALDDGDYPYGQLTVDYVRESVAKIRKLIEEMP